jgi:calcium-dependent protein kinase
MKLDHPNIIKFHEIYEDDKYFYLVQEYCSGGELLQALVKKKNFDEYKAFFTIKKIVAAVCHMHTKGIVHRDLKPENILFKSPEDDSEVKVIDFGLSNRFQESTNLTTMVGTPLYVPP